MKNVLLIGGFGFIGHHVIRELKSNGYNVMIGTRKLTVDHQEVPSVLFDLKNMNDNQLIAILKDFQFVIFAGGADDRTMPNEDAAFDHYAYHLQT